METDRLRPATIFGVFVYHTARVSTHFAFRLFSGVKIEGRANLPQSGGFVIAANHTSFLDPPLIGSSIRRQIAFMARASLFRNPLFGELISVLGAFPIDRGESDRAALRKSVGILRAGRPLLLFPEGTRGSGQEVKAFQRGFLLLVKGAGVPVVPAAIWGTHRVLPKGRSLPRPARIRLRFGTAIPANEVMAMGAPGVRDAVAGLHETIRM